jgi:ABC-type nitrate/sulfonate/bicarbonate transport system permease component
LRGQASDPRWIIGISLFLVIWQTIGSLRLAGPSVPAPLAVWAVYAEPWKLSLLVRAAGATLLSALIGLLAGCFLGVAVAILAHIFVSVRPGLDQLAVVVNSMPAIALGPILIVTVGREGTPATLASIPVFFAMYVSCSSGLRATNRGLVDAFTVFGASRIVRLRHLEMPTAFLANGLGQPPAWGL